MEPLTSGMWKNRGSSVVFHPNLLGPLLSAGCMVSLREALSWMKNWPANPPGNGKTVLVGGLEAALEVLSPEDAEELLRSQVKAFIHEFQAQWDQCGLVFGFGCSASRFQVDPSEHVLFVGPGNRIVPLSSALWNGSAVQDMYKLMFRNSTTGKDEPGGFYVRRLS